MLCLAVLLSLGSCGSKKTEDFGFFEGNFNPFTVINFTSYSDCILASLIRHPDAHSLRNEAGISEIS